MKCPYCETDLSCVDHVTCEELSKQEDVPQELNDE